METHRLQSAGIEITGERREMHRITIEGCALEAA